MPFPAAPPDTGSVPAAELAATQGIHAPDVAGLESWRLVWRAFVRARAAWPGARAALERLAEAVRSDDGRLLQGATTFPPPLMCVQDWVCEGADVVGWLGLERPLVPEDSVHLKAGDGTFPSVGEVEEGFARLCSECDRITGEPASCRYLLNWSDDTPRERMRAELAAEIRFNLTGEGP